MRTETLFDDPYAIVGRPGHPLFAAGRGAELEDLAAMDWVAQRPGTPIRAAFDGLFSGTANPPVPSIETSSLVLTRAIVIESDRLAMLSRRQIAIEDRESILRCIPVSASVAERLNTRMIGLTMRENWLPSQLQRAFLGEIHAVAADMALD